MLTKENGCVVTFASFTNENNVWWGVKYHRSSGDACSGSGYRLLPVTTTYVVVRRFPVCRNSFRWLVSRRVDTVSAKMPAVSVMQRCC